MFYLPWIFKFPLPEVWRFVTPFWVTGGGISILFDTYFCEPHLNPLQIFFILMCYQVWTYSSGLETESSRFSQPGDFFTYIIFLGIAILVRFSNLYPSACLLLPFHYFLHHILLLHVCQHTSHICPPSHHLAEAVPGDEGDHPCISCRPIIRNQSLRACMRCRHGGCDI